MNSYERVKLALAHKEPDQIPFDLGATVLTGMNISTYKKLRSYIGLPEKEAKIVDEMQQLAYIDEDMIDYLGVDVRCIDPSPVLSPLQTAPQVQGEYWQQTDEWGIGWKMPRQGGHYYDMVKHPLAEVEDMAELKNYPWPNPVAEGRFATMKERADRFVFEKQQAYVLGRFCAGIWEMALWTNGFEKFFCDMMVNESYAHGLMEFITEQKMAYWEKALATVGSNVLVVSEADDLATQISLLVSPELYKKVVHPYHKKLFSFIRSKAQSPVHIFYHSCGAISELIPLLIDEGVDVLNPVQVSAKGMDSQHLKREFGKDITFWGGGIDTQSVLPRGNPAEIREEVKRRIDHLATGGGFIFTPVHNVQSDVPPENYLAMWQAFKEYGKY